MITRYPSGSSPWYDFGFACGVTTEQYRHVLLALEAKLAERLGREVSTARDEQADQPDSSDRAHTDEVKEEYFAIAETDADTLAQVRAALRRIEDGTFGRCVVDGGRIDEKRLESIPWTPYCLKHQQEIEERKGVETPTL
jgi:RNA polymerase-binding transcription factor